MTPKEKAQEIVEQMSDFIPRCDHNEENLNIETIIRCAKQCALIAVNEIIESRKDDIAFNDTMWENASEYYKPHPMYLNYWFKLRQEIEKL